MHNPYLKSHRTGICLGSSNSNPQSDLPTMVRRAIPTLGFEDLAVDDEWESPGRTVTEADVVAYAGVSGDFNPIHLDHESSRLGSFGAPVAHGLLGLAIASGLASGAPRVDTIALLAVEEWSFLRPIRFGDTVRLISRVAALQPQSRGRRAAVTWHRQLVDQGGRVLQEGQIRTLVRSRSRDDDDGPPVPDA